MNKATVQHKLLCSVSEFADTAGELEQFLARSSSPCAFLSPTWLLRWCEVYLPSSAQLWVHVYYQNDRIVGFAPFYLDQVNRGSGLILHILGEGEPEESEVSSEYPDIMFDEECKQACMLTLGKSVRELPGLRELVFKRVLAESNLADLMRSLTPQWAISETPIGYRFVLDIQSDERSQIQQFPSSTLRRHARRWLDKFTHITVIDHSAAGTVDTGFASLVSLHNKSWQLRGQPGAFADARFLRFHQQHVQRLHESKQLCLLSVLVEGTPCAVFYGWYFQDTLYYYQSGIERTESGPGFGILLHMQAIAAARQKGCLRYDMMLGAEKSYKADYVTAESEMLNFIGARGLRSFRLHLRTLLKKFRRI